MPTALWGYLTDNWTVMVLATKCMSGALCEWSPVITLNTSRFHKTEVNAYMIDVSFLQCY